MGNVIQPCLKMRYPIILEEEGKHLVNDDPPFIEHDSTDVKSYDKQKLHKQKLSESKCEINSSFLF